MKINYPQNIHMYFLFFFFKILFIFRERGREGEGGGEKHQWVVSRPKLGTRPATQHVPSLRIKPVTFQFAGQHSIHRTMPARAVFSK